mgnify:FL=1
MVTALHQALLGITVPPIVVCVLLLLWHALTFHSLFLCFVRSILEENLWGKVVPSLFPPPDLAKTWHGNRGVVLVLVSLMKLSYENLHMAVKIEGPWM